jgi:hypothetical protein
MEKNIYKKLLDFQKLGISIKKGSMNPHFKNKYADMNEVLDKIKSPLNEMGIVVLQIPEAEGLKTTLYDTESNTEVSGFLPFVQRADAQKLGSNITYNRRYSLITMLGLEDSDDDGQKASEPELSLEDIMKKIAAVTSVDDLNRVYKSFSPQMQKDEEVIAKCKEVKNKLEALTVSK